MGCLGCSGLRFGRGGWVDGGVVAGGMSLVSLWRGSSSTCLRLFVVVVWLVFVGGLGGIATIGAALRRVAGVSVVYGRKTPRAVACKGQRRLPGLPLVGLTCVVEGLVLPPNTPSDHLRCPGRQVRSGRSTGAELPPLPPLPPLPASPEPRVGQDVSGITRRPLVYASQNPTGAGKGPSVAWDDADGPQTQHEAHKPSEGLSRA